MCIQIQQKHAGPCSDCHRPANRITRGLFCLLNGPNSDHISSTNRQYLSHPSQCIHDVSLLDYRFEKVHAVYEETIPARWGCFHNDCLENRFNLAVTNPELDAAIQDRAEDFILEARTDLALSNKMLQLTNELSAFDEYCKSYPISCYRSQRPA